MTLTPQHYAKLHTESAIADEVITARGYISLDDPVAVQALGFPAWQAKSVPALAIPLWNVYGQQSSWQIRPDSPRLSKGKLRKYETMAESRLQLDVPPSVQPFLGDPRVPLWVTEGVKKGDALASAGACAIALMGGVWGFKGTNEYGAKGVILTDWQSVALNGRKVYVVFDSDSHTKKQVAQALKALCDYLRSRDALPTPIEWPEAYRGEKKWGVDDFLAAGHTLDDLLAMVPPSDAVPSPAPPPNGTAPSSSPRHAHPDPNEFLTDHFNARALVDASGAVLRYCKPWKCWLIWTGTHWQRDASGEVLRFALQAVKGLATRIPSLGTDEANKLLKHITSSLSTVRLEAMLKQAQVGQGIPVLPEDLDRDPWLLNCQNGTLHLKTGKLLDHDREHLLTKCLPVAYDPQATCPTWEAFLWRIMGGTDRPKDTEEDSAGTLEARDTADKRAKEYIAFLQRAVGYALTGVIREHVLPVLWGNGRNGKSTFLNTLRLLLGAYAMKAPSELLMLGPTDRHPTERADLYGKRFVAVIETEEGRRLAEVFAKEATGGDPIRARRMREDFWEFWPTHKLFLATNHKPVIKGTDIAIKARIKLVEFTVTITDPDTTLPDTLQAEFPGILAWAVRGCLEWQRLGLQVPSGVDVSTTGYFAEMDVLGSFIEDCCVVGDSRYTARASALYEAYKRWCDHNGESIAPQRAWGMALTERGFVRYPNNGVWYRGIGLPQEAKKEKDHEK